METLIIASEHRNQYYGEKSLGHERFIRSARSKTFKQINCRTFQYGVGLLPRPDRTSSTPITKVALPRVQSPRSPKSVLPVFNPPSVDTSRTCPIPIANSNCSKIRRSSSEFVDKRRSFSYSSELWAGPTYSNSPPPAFVPIPKFSLRQKRTVSVRSLSPDSAVDICEVAKSAPVSPPSSGNNPFHGTVSATMSLRRMLNLELESVD